ncbi:hypothetical protein NQ318_010705 [Aromia moschata]|uniref:C2H2-type domain-containing protein n=1 Tax=Aromia moschata TaxID=1265417 RepID=A0AAV8XMC6_9CUCU|nr:hypothetical protein NQ318_010705 [Aromia moschata]
MAVLVNGNDMLSPVESNQEVCGGIEMDMDKSYNPETNHTVIKTEPCQDVETAQNQQEIVMEYQELEGCLGIKLEEPDIKQEEAECESVMPSEDTEMKFYVDDSYNSETNYVFVKSEPNQNSPEIETEYPEGQERYYCKLCPYVAKRKRDLSKHVPIHQRSLKTRTYDCSFCSYKAKQKGTLTRHMLIHKDASEVTTYQCTLCSYTAKVKSYVTEHMLIHRDASEITTYDCSFCPYKAKRKGDLTKHMWIHKDASEITTYQCTLCPYKAKQQGNLNEHMLVHKNASEVTTYNCCFCSYKTKWKRNLLRHKRIHKDASKVTTYDCSFCSYKAKHEGDLRSHTLIHKDVSEDVKSAQNEEQNIMQYQSEGCLAIKSEELDIKEDGDKCEGVTVTHLIIIIRYII